MFNKKDTKKNKDDVVANPESNGKVLSGVVVSDKMTNTGVVEVKRYFKHPKYGKFINKAKKYKFDDKGNTAHIGDTVEIVETKPISKDKKFRLSKIISKAPLSEVSDDESDNK